MQKNLTKNETVPTTGKKKLLFRFLFWGGRICSWACVFFIFLKLYVLWDKIEQIRMTPKNFLYWGVIVAAWSVVSYGFCAMWGNIVECLSGKSLNFTELAHLYSKSNLAKYLPGNVMHYVSRSILAQKYQIPLQTTALASILDALICVISAFLFVLFTLHQEFFTFIELMINFAKGWIWIAGIIFVAALLLSCGLFWKIRASGVLRMEKHHAAQLGRAVFRNCILYLGHYLFISCIFYFLLVIIDSNDVHSLLAQVHIFGKISGFFMLGWLAGYLVPGASGGIGVREAMFLFLLSPFYSQGTILASAFLLRLLGTLAEIIAYMLSVLLRKNPAS
jgi:hypothetical protein